MQVTFFCVLSYIKVWRIFFWKSLWLIYWLWIGRIDYKTYTIPKRWILLSVPLVWAQFQAIEPLSFAYPLTALALWAIRTQWIGYADVVYLFELAALLEPAAMNQCLLIAVLAGFVLVKVRRCPLVPFVSCLALGVVVSTLL